MKLNKENNFLINKSEEIYKKSLLLMSISLAFFLFLSIEVLILSIEVLGLEIFCIIAFLIYLCTITHLYL